MKHARIAILFGILLMISLVASMPIVLDVQENSIEPISEKPNRFTLSYDTHTPIKLDNNTHFNDTAIAEGWPGYGNSTHPFIIGGWNITGTGYLIDIENVTLNFKISNCFINNTGLGSIHIGISIYNSSSFVIEDTNVYGGWYGISLVKCNYSQVDNSLAKDATLYGINVVTSINITIFECHAFDNDFSGIYVNTCYNISLEGNSVYSNRYEGVQIQGSDFCKVIENFVYDNPGSGVYVYNSHNCTFESNDIYNNSISITTGIHVSWCDNGTILNNDIHDNPSAGIYLTMSDNWHIEGNWIFNNSDYGISGSGENVTVVANNITQNGWWDGGSPLRAGISFGEAKWWTIESNDICNNTPSGISVSDATFSTISNNNIWDNAANGINGDWADDINVLGNNLWGNGWLTPADGISLTIQCDRWLIEGNTLWNNTDDGIYSVGITCTILNNDISNSSRYGITAWQTYDAHIESNTLHHNQIGVAMRVIGGNITDNIIYDNDYGIHISQSGLIMVWGNDVGWNDVNGYGSGNQFPTYWYNNYTDEGNHWEDYDGVGAYVSGSVNDPYPSKSLDLNASTYLTYELGDTGNTMTWPAYALNPMKYEVYLNDNSFYNGTWDGTDIVVDVDSIDAGNHEIMVIAYHISGHSTNETMDLDVTDNANPVWSPPPTDQELNEGVPFSYQVTATDPSGIGGYSVNDTVNFEISSSGLITNVTTLAAGQYGLNISVWDAHGNTLSYVIKIRVLYVAPTTTTTTTTTTSTTTTTTTTDTTTDTETSTPPPIDMETLSLVILGAGGAVLVIIVIVFLRKRG
ncbi:MAG: right-handed parallel beta-helix repeat-containing protein [Candidatus Thorarchaeota archaeon]|nr:right-handed parallel beta-helix repeat-containing protein [Candidatus Thorarchaeota archaeon]